MTTRLDSDFFARDTVEVACELLGVLLVHRIDGQRVSGRIVETEAYGHPEDAGSHAFRGWTVRNAPMFGPVGYSYVYFIYGNYWMFNIIAKPPDVTYGAAVLIRALEPVEGLELMAARRSPQPQRHWTSGPARLALALGIEKRHNNTNLCAPGSDLWLEPAERPADWRILSGPRVGLNSVPEPWRTKPLRFWLADNPYISPTR